MKTLHRLMYENLSQKEYKNFCKVNDILLLRLKIDYSEMSPSDILIESFNFYRNTPQGESKEYWYDVYERLENEGK